MPPPQGAAAPPAGGGMQQNPYGGQPGPMQPGYPGQNLMNDPMANMAMQYGASLADQGKDVVEKQVIKVILSPLSPPSPSPLLLFLLLVI